MLPCYSSSTSAAAGCSPACLPSRHNPQAPPPAPTGENNVNGFGLEFYIETPADEIGTLLSDIKKSWQFQLLFTVSQLAAGAAQEGWGVEFASMGTAWAAWALRLAVAPARVQPACPLDWHIDTNVSCSLCSPVCH